MTFWKIVIIGKVDILEQKVDEEVHEGHLSPKKFMSKN